MTIIRIVRLSTLIIAQSWPWDSQIAVEKKSDNTFYQFSHHEGPLHRIKCDHAPCIKQLKNDQTDYQQPYLHWHWIHNQQLTYHEHAENYHKHFPNSWILCNTVIDNSVWKMFHLSVNLLKFRNFSSSTAPRLLIFFKNCSFISSPSFRLILSWRISFNNSFSIFCNDIETYCTS